MNYWIMKVIYYLRVKNKFTVYALCCFFSLTIVTACGLPSVISIEAPTMVFDLSTSIVAFRTPEEENPNIRGYVLYYKIYTGLSDQDRVAIGDKSAFDASASSNDELAAGEKIPREKGFFRMEYLESQRYEYTISHAAVGSDTVVYIDFKPDPNKEYQPIVYTDPDNRKILATLARGIVDPRDNSTYSTQGDGELYTRDINPGDNFRLFYNDWKYDEHSKDGDNTDSDLRRNKNTNGLLQYQPGHSDDDLNKIRENSTPLTHIDENPLQTGSTLIIAIAVHTIGRNVASGKLESLNSIPVHLGYISMDTGISNAR